MIGKGMDSEDFSSHSSALHSPAFIFQLLFVPIREIRVSHSSRLPFTVGCLNIRMNL